MRDLSQMRELHVDPAARTARAAADCLLGDVDRATRPYGLAAPLGLVTTTALAGLTLGGGFGWLTQRFGWTCDNLVSVKLATASGDEVVASATENDALFRILRGGGGNFGR